MRGISKVYSYINILSIDVAIGACIMALFIGNIVNASIPLSVLSSLAISVWLIYTVDHLKDAKTITHPSHTKRHQFHQMHFSQIRWAVFVILPVQIILLFFLPLYTFFGGSLLLAVVLFYFTILWTFDLKNIYHKEIAIAIVYTCGVFIPVFGRISIGHSTYLTFLFIQITLLAFSNLLIFSMLEMSSDKLDHQSSLALLIGKTSTKRTVFAILLFGLLLSVCLIFTLDTAEVLSGQIIILIMNLILVSILTFKFLRREERFRYLGDGIFYVPLLHLLWQ